MRVYRYLRAEHALEALQTKTWKLGRLGDLNDPFDCQPVLTKAPDQGTSDANAAFAREYLRGLHVDTGLIAYSARIDDPVIWSHYAESHRGIALAFEFGELGGLMKVDYSEIRPQIDYIRVEELRTRNAREAIMEVIAKGFTVKAPSWTYEDEYRHFIRLGSSSCSMKGAHYFCAMPKVAFKGVILGARCSIEAEDIRRLVAGWNRSVEIQVVKAVADARTYRINA